MDYNQKNLHAARGCSQCRKLYPVHLVALKKKYGLTRKNLFAVNAAN
jgi:hypothetical protein